MLYRIDVVGVEEGQATAFEYSVHGNPFDLTLNLRFHDNREGGYTHEQVCMIIDWLGLRKWLTVKSITLIPFSE